DIQVAGPGFINFFLDRSFLTEVLEEIRAAGTRYGCSDVGGGQRVNVEFVSANPTGSLHLGHARGAAVGDSLCNILEAAGYDVTREYYINRSEEHTSELQSRENLVCRLLLEKKKSLRRSCLISSVCSLATPLM